MASWGEIGDALVAKYVPALDCMWHLRGRGPVVRVQADVASRGGMDDEHGCSQALGRPSLK